MHSLRRIKRPNYGIWGYEIGILDSWFVKSNN
jgi:hypothetical protein